MKKIFILSGIAMLCLFSHSNVSSATVSPKKASAIHFKVKKGKSLNTVIWSYSNSNSFSILVTFWQFGHPASVFTIPAGYSSGTFSVVPGTYNVEFTSSGPEYVITFGYGDQNGSDVTFNNVSFTTDYGTSFVCDLPQ